MLDRCIAQLDEGVILANQAGQNSALYRWTQDAAALLFEIREGRRNAANLAQALKNGEKAGQTVAEMILRKVHGETKAEGK